MEIKELIKKFRKILKRQYLVDIDVVAFLLLSLSSCHRHDVDPMGSLIGNNFSIIGYSPQWRIWENP